MSPGDSTNISTDRRIMPLSLKSHSAALLGFLKPRRVYLMTPNLVPHDAIGNDVLGMAQSLRRSGYEVEIYAEAVHPSLAGTADTLDVRAQSFWRDRNA